MRVRIGLVVAIFALVALPASAQAAIPLNDNYLNFVKTNDPGTPMPKYTTVQWNIGLAGGNDPSGAINEATTQANMGDAGATAEATSCNSVDGSFVPSITRTVWYWTFPDVNGWYDVEIRGGDAVIRTIPVGSGNRPAFNASRCLDDSSNSDPVERDFFAVEGGGGAAYAIQAGVYAGSSWTGSHRALVTFYPDRDLDRLFDRNDRCPTQVGPSSLAGCPDRDGDRVPNIDDRCPTVYGTFSRGCPDADGDGNAEGINDACPGEKPTRDVKNNGCQDFGILSSRTPYAFDNVYRGSRLIGIRFSRIKVTGEPKGTRIKLSCKPKRRCKRKSTTKGRTFLKNKLIRIGTRITLKITKKGYVGRLITFRVKSKRKGGFRVGRVKKSVRCYPATGGGARSCKKVTTDR